MFPFLSCLKFFVRLLPINMWEGIFDGVDEIVIIQCLESHILVTNTEFHFVDQFVGFWQFAFEFFAEPIFSIIIRDFCDLPT